MQEYTLIEAMIKNPKSDKIKKSRLHAILIAAIILLIVIGVTIGLIVANNIITPESATTTPKPAPITVATPEPIKTGFLQLNGEPGYNIYLDDTKIGTLDSYVQTFSGIKPGTHTLMVELYGVTGSMPVIIEPEKTTSASIGLSKNQILVRMAKVLGWNKPYPYNPFEQ